MGIGSPNPLLLATAAGSGGDSDPVTRSLRLDGGESLSRTFSSTGDSKKFTFACWVKRTKLGGDQRIFQASNSNNDDFLRFNNDNTLGYWIYQNGSHNHQGNTTAVFRDVSAWMHVCYVVDTAQSTAANRVKIFVNGVSHTLSVYPDQNRDCSIMNTAALHYIGRYGNSGSEYANLYIDDAYFLDGEAVEPVGNFIESNDYGGYKPKVYTGSFGTNGFHLEFEDSSSIGEDSSGNSNDWTATNLASSDVVLSTPTKCYAVINPLIPYGTATNSHTVTLTEGNLRVDSGSGSGWGSQDATIAASSGKFYFEAYVLSSSHSTGGQVGVHPVDGWVYAGSSTQFLGATNTSVAYLSSGGFFTNGSTTSTGYDSYTTGDVIGCAFDVDSRKVWFSKNGTWQNSSDPANDSNPAVTLSGSGPLIAAVRAYLKSWILNFGQDPTFSNQKSSGQDTSQSEFYYAPPSGFKSLNTANLDDPTIKAHEHFNTKLYSGSYAPYTMAGSTTQAITGVGFQPDIVWIKDRDNASGNYENYNSYYGHYLFDSLRGAGSAFNLDGDVLYSSTYLNSGENGIDSFDTDGFTVDEAEETNFAYDSDYDSTVDGYERYAAWCWKLGQTGSSSTWASGNTNPTSEKYNANAGVSLLRYEDSSYSSGTVTLNHSLGAAPEFAFVGNAYGSYDFPAWHKDLSANNYLSIDSTSNQSSGSSYFPSGCATATTFTVGSSIASGYADLYIYLFSSVDGVSKVGSYTGNGSANGPFVYTGFRPAFVMVKAIDAGYSWYIHDTARSPYNYSDLELTANSSGAEYSVSGAGGGHRLDILCNGFKHRTSNAAMNQSGYKYAFLAFSESPLKDANAR